MAQMDLWDRRRLNLLTRRRVDSKNKPDGINHENFEKTATMMRGSSLLRKSIFSQIPRRAWYAGKPSAKPMSELSESWANPNSANYLESMFRAWEKDPSSVHASWQAYFANLDAPAGV